MRGRGLAGALIALVLGACGSQEAMIESLTDPEDRSRAVRYIDSVRMREFGVIERDLDPTIRAAATPQVMEQMAALFPPGSPATIRQVGAFTHTFNDARLVNLTFEYGYGDRWLMVNVVTKSTGGTRTITGFNVVPRDKSLEEENRFTLEGKEAKHFAILAAAFAIPLFILTSMVLCLRTPIRKRKWAWLLFIVFGIGVVGINWSSGEVHFLPVFILLLGASATQAPYGPWIINAAMPLGAVIFLLNRRRLLTDVQQPQDAGTTAGATP